VNADLEEFGTNVAEKAARRVLELAEERWKSDLAGVHARIGQLADIVQARKMLDSAPEILLGRSPKVLLVDDNVSLVHAIGTQLERSGIDIMMSTTVADALASLEAEPAIEVALVDAVMPKNGHTLLEHIRDEYRAIQVIMTSGKNVDPAYAIERGAFGFLAKPFELTEAVMWITRAAERRRQLLAAGIR
jgi:CheY-like chemotaxis protein